MTPLRGEGGRRHEKASESGMPLDSADATRRYSAAKCASAITNALRLSAAREQVIGLYSSSPVLLSVGGGWPAPGFKDTELGVFMEPEVDHGEAEVYARRWRASSPR